MNLNASGLPDNPEGQSQRPAEEPAANRPSLGDNPLSRRQLVVSLGPALIAAFGARSFLYLGGIETTQGDRKPNPDNVRAFLRSRLQNSENLLRAEEVLERQRSKGDSGGDCTCDETCNCDCPCECTCTCSAECDCVCQCSCECDCGCDCICQ